MGKLIMVTGGARSGKSSHAEELAKACGSDVLYIATSVVTDSEMEQRVKKHREQRPSWWETLEAYKDFDICLQKKVENKSAVLLDCITVMTTNLMLEKLSDINNISPESSIEAENYVRHELDKLINAAMDIGIPFIFVTNEVGMGIVPEYPLSRIFRDIAGRGNQTLSKAADEVYFCVSGIPVKIKG